MAKRNWKTAAEWFVEREKDPEYLAMKKAQDEHFEKVGADLAKAQAPLVQALNEAGANATSVYDVASRTEPYPELIPILLEHIRKPYPVRILAGIARALAVPEASVGWRSLVNMFVSDPDPTTFGTKWAVGFAIGQAADLSTLDELIRLIKDPANGENRSALLYGLYRFNDPRAKQALAELAKDPFFARDIKVCRRLSRKLHRGQTPTPQR